MDAFDSLGIGYGDFDPNLLSCWANEDDDCANYQIQRNDSGTKNSADSLHGDVTTMGSFSDEVTLMQPSQQDSTWAYSSVNKTTNDELRVNTQDGRTDLNQTELPITSQDNQESSESDEANAGSDSEKSLNFPLHMQHQRVENEESNAKATNLETLKYMTENMEKFPSSNATQSLSSSNPLVNEVVEGGGRVKHLSSSVNDPVSIDNHGSISLSPTTQSNVDKTSSLPSSDHCRRSPHVVATSDGTLLGGTFIAQQEPILASGSKGQSPLYSTPPLVRNGMSLHNAFPNYLSNRQPVPVIPNGPYSSQQVNHGDFSNTSTVSVSDDSGRSCAQTHSPTLCPSDDKSSVQSSEIRDEPSTDHPNSIPKAVTRRKGKRKGQVKSSTSRRNKKQKVTVPPFYLFDSPFELRTNFIQSTAGIPSFGARVASPQILLNDCNSYHYNKTAITLDGNSAGSGGFMQQQQQQEDAERNIRNGGAGPAPTLVINGFHPQLNASYNPTLPLSNGINGENQFPVLIPGYAQNHQTTTILAAAPNESGVVVMPPFYDARHKNKKSGYKERNEREQKRAQKITDLIEDLRQIMMSGGWQVEMKSKFHTLSTCGDFVRELKRTTQEREDKVDEMKLKVKEQETERKKANKLISAPPEAAGDDEACDDQSCDEDKVSRQKHHTSDETLKNENELKISSAEHEAKESLSEIEASLDVKNDEESSALKPENFRTDEVLSNSNFNLPKKIKQIGDCESKCSPVENSCDIDYHDVFGTSNVPQLIATAAGRIVTANNFFLKLTGLTDSEVRFLTIFSIVRPDHLPKLFEISAQALRRSSTASRDCNFSDASDSVVSSMTDEEGDLSQNSVDSLASKRQKNHVGSHVHSTDRNGKQLKFSHHASVTLPCVIFPAYERLSSSINNKSEDGACSIPFYSELSKQLFMTVTLLTNESPDKKCFHCALTDCAPKETGSMGHITPQLLRNMFSRESYVNLSTIPDKISHKEESMVG